jgi:hypothetical protein
MPDIKDRIAQLELKAAERELVGALAADTKVRDASRRLAHDLREEAFRLRNALPKSTPEVIPAKQPQHA